MKLARPQLRTLPGGTVVDPSNNYNNNTSSNGNSSMPPSFADLSDESSKRSHHKKSSTKKKEKSTHKRHSSQGTTSSTTSSKRSSHRSSSLPTIYAENRESFSDFNGDLNQQLGGSDHDDDDDDTKEEKDDDNRKMPANLTDEDRAKNRRRSQEQDAFVPAQLQLKPSKKKKSSLRKSSKKKSTQSNKTSSTITATTEAEWDDLGEELGTALQRSLGIAEGNNSNSNNDYSPSKNKKGDKQQKKNRNNNTTTPDDDNDLPPWKCPACTFKNEPLHLVCAICGTAAVALTKSVGSSSSGRASSHLSASQLSAGGGGHLSASYMSTQNIPLNNTHRLYGSSDNLANSNGGEFRRSTLGEESLNRSHGNNNNNNNNTNGGGGAYNPQVDPHNHRRMNSGRRHSDDMSNDSEGYSYNIQEQVDFQDQRRKSRENDYYDRDLSHRSTRGGGGGDYRSSRRRASLSGDGGRPRNLRRSQFEDDREARRGFSQSMQLDSNRGERIGGNGSVNSGHRHHRSRRRTEYDDDSLSRRSRTSRDEYRSSKDYRRSTMHDMDYDGGRGYDRDRDRSGSIGRYRESRRGGGRYRDDYSDASESLGTKGRITGGQYYDDGSIVSEMSDDEATFAERTVRTMQTIKKMVIPSGEVTIIYTDVQGSTALWEADPMSMKKATDIHDSIIRRCYSDHGGYEITTEGDAFNLAFQHPADAIGFALKAQLALYRAKWPEGTLGHPDGCDNEKKKFRGFRVRFGMHHGPTTSTVHKTTGRTTYQGEAVEVAKAIEKMSHGGQILTTVETWRTVSGMAEQLLGSPQVMDCGEHLLWDPKKTDLAKKKSSAKKVLSKRIVQLVPNSLSYDFFAARGGQEVKEGEAPQKVCGRVFPPLLSHGQLSTSFLNAPYIGNKVAMVFVYTDKMEAIEDRERKKNFKILAKYVRSHLMRLSPPGYECQEDKGSWMLAFDRIDNGINFGLDLKENVMKNAKLLGDVDKSQVFRVGIHWGPFLSMGPHTVTGHADYFGPIVNRAARVAAQCEAGQICVGVPMGTDEEPPDPGPTVEVDVLGVKQLKGISIEMAIFGCRKKDKEEES